MPISATSALGHEMRHTVASAQSIMVSVSYADESPLAFGYFEIRAMTDDALVQTGQTDAKGRLVFVPQATERYRVRVFSDDGHGIDIVVPVDAAGLATGLERPIFERYARAIAGVGLLLGLFGAIALLRCGRGHPKST